MNFMKNRTTVGILCIILSLVVCFGVTPLFNKSASQKTEIVRVAKEIKAGDEITGDMVQLVKVGGYNLPENIIKTKDTVVGNYAVADFFAGDYILSTKVSASPAYENGYLYRLDGTKQAMSLTLQTFASGLSGKLKSGDIVSVIAANYKEKGITLILPELKYVEVISVTAPSGHDANTERQKDEERELPSTVTLLVTPKQSTILAELEAEGKSHLSLVFRGNREQAQQFITMQEQVIANLYPSKSKGEIQSQNPNKEEMEGA